jgi:protein SSD1
MDRDAVAKVAQQCNMFVFSFYVWRQVLTQSCSKRDSAILAQEQSNHLFLCVLVADLTQRYGPVIRQAKVVGVLDAAFDVLVPEFGIEKRVHVDQMPIDVRYAIANYDSVYSILSHRITFTTNTRTLSRSTGPTVT